MHQLAIEAIGVKKAFGSVSALVDLRMEVHRGEIFGLLGPNGAGKTTTVKILTTLVKPDSGSARVAGFDVVKEPDRVREKIGYVPQEITVDPYLSPREHLEYYAGLYHLSRRSAKNRIHELLLLVGLEADAERPVRRFSGGMKKKLDLICGLLHDPEVLFLDEPSLGLDVQIRRDVWGHVLKLKDEGAAILLCTNSMDEADTLCDRLSIIHQGKVVVTGNPLELKKEIEGDSVSIEIATDGSGALARLEAAFAALPFVKGTRSNRTRVEVRVESSETALPKLMEVAMGSGVPVQSIAYRRPGLEEVFLQHTGAVFADADRRGGT
jgi:ABC-2 type transport system ATP-binding protein